jgi:hypothetical protein
MTTTISRPFKFAEYLRFVVPSHDEATWKPIARTPEDVEDDPVRNKWIYAFQRCDGKLELYAEFFADGRGELALFAGRDARVLERDKRPAPTPTGSNECTLPHTINGKRAFYFFVVSRIRLPLASIRSFEAAAPKGVGPDVDLARDDSFVAVIRGPGAMSPTDSYHLVVDPITIALNLHEPYESACNDVLQYTVEFAEQTPTQKITVRNRQNAILVARLLKSVLDSDPSDQRLGLNDHFKKGRAAVSEFIDGYERKLKALLIIRDQLAEPIVHFKRGSLFNATEESYRVFETQDYAKWLELLSGIMERLNESSLGKAHIGALVRQPDYAFREYVNRSTPAAGDQFQVGKQAASAITKLWGIAVVDVASRTPDGAQKAASALNNISHEKLVTVEQKTVTFKLRKVQGERSAVTMTVTQVSSPGSEALKAWAGEHGGPGGVAKALADLTSALEIANVSLSLVALAQAEPGKRQEPLFNLLGSVLSAVSAFEPLLKIGLRAGKAAGGLSSCVDAYFATRAGFDAWNLGDRDSAVGYGIVVVASAVSAAGCFCAVAGVGSSATGVGIPLGVLLEAAGAVLGTAGWILAVLAADTALQAFVEHCFLGRSYPTKSTVKPKGNWLSGDSFADWSSFEKGVDHQMRSLFNLLGAFTLTATDATTLRVQLGMTSPETKVSLKIRTVYRSATGQPGELLRKQETELKFDIAQRTMVRVDGDLQDTTSFLIADVDGRPCLTFTARWPSALARPGELAQSCDAQVKVLLDDKTELPVGKFLPFRVSNFGGLGASLSSHDE